MQLSNTRNVRVRDLVGLVGAKSKLAFAAASSPAIVVQKDEFWVRSAKMMLRLRIQKITKPSKW
jgi:hypothetical protein